MPLNFEEVRKTPELWGRTEESPTTEEMNAQEEFNKQEEKKYWGEKAEQEYNRNQERSFAEQKKEDEILASWNYKNPQGLGPQGEPLPTGALGWKPDGNVFWGNSISGWWKELTYNITKPSLGYDITEPIVALEPTVDVHGRTATNATQYFNPLETIGNVWQRLTDWTPEGGQPSVGEMASRALGETIKTGLGVIGDIAEKTIEQTWFGVGAGLEEAGEGSFLPELDIKTVWLDKFLNGSPPVYLYNALRTATSPIPLSDKLSILNANAEAGRIAYTGMFYPAQQEEYVQRYKSGENALLLEMELEDPWIELAGELILDPLNAFDWIGGAKRLVGKIDDARDLLYKLPEAIEAVIRVGSENLDDIAAATRYTELATDIVGENILLANGLTDYARKTGAFVSTYGGKQHKFARATGTVINHVLSTFNKEPQKAVDVFKAMALAGGNDIDEIATGIQTISKYKNPRILLSEAGRETGYLLRKLIGETDTGKLSNGNKLMDTIKGADGDLAKLAEGLGGMMDEAISSLFPSMTKRIADYDAAVKAQKAGKILTESQAFALTDKISDGTRWLEKMHTVAQGMFYKPVMSLQSAAYLGLSGGYPTRNGLMDGLLTIVHHGIGSFKHSTKTWIENANAWSGGLANVGIKEGIGSIGATVSDIWGWTQKLPGIVLAKKVEQASSARISGYTIEKVMRQGLKALPGSDILRGAGLDNRGVAFLRDALLEAKGDVKTAANKLRSILKQGSIKGNETIAYLGDDVIKRLNKVESIDANVREAVLTSKNKEEALAKIQDVFKEVRSLADGLADETTSILDDFVGKDAVGELGAASEKVGINSELVDKIKNKFMANQNAVDAIRTSLNNLGKGIVAEISNAVKTKQLAAQKALKIKAGITDILLNDFTEMENGYKALVTKADDFKLKWLDNWYNTKVADLPRRDPVDPELWNTLVKNFDLQDVAPPLNNGELKQIWWTNCFSKWMDANYIGARETYATTAKKIAEGMMKLYKPTEGGTGYFKYADESLALARNYDNTLRPLITRFEYQRAVKIKDNATAARVLARQFNITAEAGENLDSKLLKIINDSLVAEGKKVFPSLDKVPPALSSSRLRKYATAAPEAGKVAEEAGILGKLDTPFDGQMATRSRYVKESMSDINELEKTVLGLVDNNYDSAFKVAGNIRLDKAIGEWESVAESGVGELRYLASKVADAARDFTLHAYPEKIGLDLALSYVFPYQFWYSRTYTKFLKTIVTNPGTIAAYAKYKEKMGRLHAGMPEWYKYNINSNDLPGIDLENPLFFNLEATLNPLYGLTGVDFNDKYKRINWWTAAADDMNKFGPSIWTPYTMAIATILSMQGEADAASRWGGRLIPATGAIKSLTALLNVGPPGGLEIDPNIWLFSNGIDAYERNRVGRALGWLVEKGEITQTEAVDAAYSQSGDIWDTAYDWATKQRAPGQLASFLFGVGFKARNVYDMQIDQFYGEYYRLLNMRPLMSSEEVSQAWNDLRTKYPFMDTVLLAKKPAGADRDTAMAYNVLSRIPPGQKDDLFKLFGITYDQVQKFYEDKGAIETWTAGDKLSFMGAILSMASVLSIPDNATRAEYSKAAQLYGSMMDAIKKGFGEDIDDKINEYYRLLDTDHEAADQYLIDNPEVTQAMNFKDETIINNETLRTYYSSVEMIEDYYEGLMYEEIRRKCGDNTDVLWDEYNQAKLDGWGNKYWKAHPELQMYMDIKEKYTEYIYETISTIANSLNEVPWGEIREEGGAGAEKLREYTEQERDLGLYGKTQQEWQQEMSPSLWNLVLDKINNDEYLSENAESQLEYIANKYDISLAKLLEIIAAAP